ncbi:MAG: CapA family protein, partial [Deltaproteobacteria bacterium]|nr:CapA family protein [Deltaproteobacteria bacterium]
MNLEKSIRRSMREGSGPAWFTGIRGMLACLLTALVMCLTSCGDRSGVPPFELGGDLPEGAQIRILFGGDTAFAESYGETQRRLLEEKGYDFPLAAVKPLLKMVDLAVCNLETPITHFRKSPYDGQKAYVHWTHAAYAPKAYRANGMLALSLANNHTLDYGVEGLHQTLEILNRNGISWFGAGMNEAEAERPFVRGFNAENLNFRLAVIGAFQYSLRYDLKYGFYADGEKGGCRKLSKEAIQHQVAELKARDPDIYVVVYPHWGNNYEWKTARQTLLGRAMIEAGADLVIGHGAHGMQEIERYRGKWILYNLGNFV